jgi:type II secretory pathway component GspD/PulD (secretin)
MNSLLFATSTTLFVLLFLAARPEQGLSAEAQAGGYVAWPLVHADAVESAKRLIVCLGSSADVFAHKGSNTVFVRSSPAKTRRVAEILHRLDMPAYSYVVPLKNASAATTSVALRVILATWTLLGDDRDVLVAADRGGNSILIVASVEKAKEVRSIVAWLDWGSHSRSP